ncbi:hypothetical protein [Azonexus fungiphilus]|nr:hypothetical protein [Azonexus fungiphilus]NHC05540.1 hypothetical protein [Azonexus fungiphilus]
MSKPSTIHLTLPEDLVFPVPSDAEIELIASMLGELMLLVLRFNDSEDD